MCQPYYGEHRTKYSDGRYFTDDPVLVISSSESGEYCVNYARYEQWEKRSCVKMVHKIRRKIALIYPFRREHCFLNDGDLLHFFGSSGTCADLTSSHSGHSSSGKYILSMHIYKIF